MLMLSLVRILTVVIPWMLNLAIWPLARTLNMPEPLVHDTGVFVFAQVQTIENRVGKALCPMRLFRQLRRCCALNLPPPSPHAKENWHDPAIAHCCAAPFSPTPFSAASRPSVSRSAPACWRPAQPAGGAAARDRAVPDRLYRAGRLARHAGNRCRRRW